MPLPVRLSPTRRVAVVERVAPTGSPEMEAPLSGPWSSEFKVPSSELPEPGTRNCNAALVTAIRAGPKGRRAGAEAEVFPHDLSRSPGSEVARHGEWGDLRQQRIRVDVVYTGAGPRRAGELVDDIVGERDERGGHIAGQVLRVEDDVAFQIHSGALHRAIIGQDDDGGVGVLTADLRLVDDGVVNQRVEVALLGVGGLVHVEE